MYLIRVLGAVDASWLEYFGGISIAISTLSDKSCISTICAHEADQSALIGLLDSLYNSQFPIVSVDCLAPATG